MPLRLLNVIRSVNPAHGGPVEVIRQFAPAMEHLGHHVETVCMDAPDAEWVGTAGFSVHAVGGNASTYGRSPALLDWLKHEHGRFDAVIAHGLWQYHGKAVREALRGTSTPYFVFPHGMLDPWFRRAYPIKHLKKQLYWWATESRVLADARRVIYTCEEERRLAQHTFFPYRAQEMVAPLGTAGPPYELADCRAAFLTAHPHLQGKRLLLYLGRLHPKKGCDLLLRAFAEFPDEIELIMAGPCEDPQFLAILQAMANGKRVHFVGMLRDELKWGAFAAAEAFILPSHQENFGMSVAEALACGVPVLISKKVNIWREIQEDGAGIVADDSLTGTRRLLEDWLRLGPAERCIMAEKARTCFLQRFEIGQSAKFLLALISEAVQEG